MIYSDGVPVDENMRVLQCPRCGNEEMDLDAEYCHICGLSLFNKCEGEQIYDDYGNWIGTGTLHLNKGNARFCKICGAKTRFFNEEVLKPYDKVKDGIEAKTIEFRQHGIKRVEKEVLDDDIEYENESLPFDFEDGIPEFNKIGNR